MSQDPDKIQDIPNTFMSGCVQKMVSINYIAEALRRGFVHPEDIPEHLRERVQDVINKRYGGGSKKAPIRI